jgi:agmatine/peptidylarginine deiminase
LASKETLSAFVNKYNVLKSVEVQLRDTNSEIDNEPFFDRVRQEKNAIGSKKTSVKHTNPEGLDKEIAIEQLSIAAPQGSYLIRLDGEDDGGDRLRGNNDDFKIRTPLKDLGDSIKSAANRMYASFNSIIENGLIVIPLIADEANNIVEEVIKRLTDDSK